MDYLKPLNEKVTESFFYDIDNKSIVFIEKFKQGNYFSIIMCYYDVTNNRRNSFPINSRESDDLLSNKDVISIYKTKFERIK